MKRMTLAAITLVALALLTIGSPSASAATIVSINAVPDGGMTVMLLGGAVGCLEVLRRRLSK